MGTPREVPEWMNAPAHNGRMLSCKSMTECAISTITLPEGSFACLVLSGPEEPFGTIAILDREEVMAHIRLLRNAIEDAERLDSGLMPTHATPSLRRS